MSLRLRLIISIGLALLILWASAAAWLWRGLSHDLDAMLDERLAMSANMVAGLVDLPATRQSHTFYANANAALLTIAAGQGMVCQIRTLEGRVLATSQTAPADLSLAIQPGYHTQTMDEQDWRTYTLQTSNLSITTAERLDKRHQLYQQIGLTVSVPFLIAMGGGLILLWLGTGRGLSPLQRLRADLASRSPANLHPLPEQGLPQELKPLIKALNQLLHRTDQAMQRERHFTNDAAHELRTPLTAIRTHLQVAELTQGEDAQTALADAQQGVQRMQATLEQLLLLARVEGELPFDDAQRISPLTAAQRAIADSAPLQPQRIQLHPANGLDDQTAGVLNIAPALAVVALRNLIENALRYSPANQPVEIFIEPAETQCVFRVVDHGTGLTADELKQATQRFWRNGQAQRGSGLGLTIVKAIVARYHGQLELHNTGNGLEACLRLPLQYKG